MNRVLNIVSDDDVIKVMRRANIPGSFLSWRDFLYRGAVPESLSLEALSKVRAKYIASQGFDSYEKAYRELQERNSTLHAFRKYDRILLWFEHDLCNQLQLIQILDWFAKYSLDASPISIIYPDKHLLICSPEKLKKMMIYNRESISDSQFLVARQAWSAFRAPTPVAWSKLLYDDTSSLPFLRDAVLRMLEEYPNTINGLSKTAHQALLIIANGIHKPYEIFEAYQQQEKRRFMRDAIFFNILKDLLSHNVLSSSHNGEYLEITAIGDRVLKAEQNWLNLIDVDFWLGGVHLTSQNIWCWDIAKQKIVTDLNISPFCRGFRKSY